MYKTAEEVKLEGKIRFLEDKLLRERKNNYTEIERLRGDIMGLRIALQKKQRERYNYGRVY